eukprot:TRINITY_DN2890_c0_g1_i3.p1 TRINITY_DN2890_c0_g1~~TRINITY_DN2890_c0_g1_i3.p1  ORF type:complete len:315 (-),score=63.76 TRINITY_DN2890_c0_g1_i3:197-1141(-)
MEGYSCFYDLSFHTSCEGRDGLDLMTGEDLLSDEFRTHSVPSSPILQDTAFDDLSYSVELSEAASDCTWIWNDDNVLSRIQADCLDTFPSLSSGVLPCPQLVGFPPPLEPLHPASSVSSMFEVPSADSSSCYSESTSSPRASPRLPLAARSNCVKRVRRKSDVVARNPKSSEVVKRQSARPVNPAASLAKDYFRRNMSLLKKFVDSQLFDEIHQVVEEMYKELNHDGKNKHRQFWNIFVVPILSQFESKLVRVALMGRMNGLCPEVARDFYTFLLYMTELCCDEQRELLLEACAMVIDVAEKDPFLKRFVKSSD